MKYHLLATYHLAENASSGTEKWININFTKKSNFFVENECTKENYSNIIRCWKKSCSRKCNLAIRCVFKVRRGDQLGSCLRFKDEWKIDPIVR